MESLRDLYDYPSDDEMEVEKKGRKRDYEVLDCPKIREIFNISDKKQYEWAMNNVNTLTDEYINTLNIEQIKHEMFEISNTMSMLTVVPEVTIHSSQIYISQLNMKHVMKHYATWKTTWNQDFFLEELIKKINSHLREEDDQVKHLKKSIIYCIRNHIFDKKYMNYIAEHFKKYLLLDSRKKVLERGQSGGSHNRCKRTTKKGTQCKNSIGNSRSKYCHLHKTTKN